MRNPLLKNWRIAMVFAGFACILGFAIGLSFCVLPGGQASAAETQEGMITLRVDVELVTVEVIALDKKGLPIRDLKKENFRLFEDGEEQEITTFEEVRDDSNDSLPTSLADVDEAGSNRGKIVLILFDDSRIKANEIQVIRGSAEKYVKQHMKPQDLFAVGAYGRSLKILQNYTHDAEKVITAIRQPAAFSGYSETSRESSASGPTRISDASGSAAWDALTPNSESAHQATQWFRSLSSLSASIAKVKGRKTVLLYGRDFSIPSEISEELEKFVRSAQKANVVFYTIDSGGVSSGAFLKTDPLGGDRQRNSWQAASKRNLGLIRSGLARPVSVTGALTPTSQNLWSFSMFQQGGGGSGGGTGGGTGSGSGGGTGSGTGSGTGGSSGSSSGGTGSGGYTDSSSEPRETIPDPFHTSPLAAPDLGEGSMRKNQGLRIPNILRSVASETGGLAIFNTNDFNDQLDKTTQELGNYYVLGFVSNNSKRDGKPRKLDVKTDLKGVTLKHRENYVDPRPLDTLAGSKTEKSLMSAMASSTMSQQLPVSFRAAYFYDASGVVKIPIEAELKTTSIQLKKKGGNLGSDINVMGVAFAENGSVAARFSETLHVLIEKAKEDAFRRQGLAYENYLKLRPGKYRLRLAFADENDKIGSTEQALTIPVLPESGLAASSLVLMRRLARLPELIQNMQAKLLDENNPLIYSGFQITPSIDNLLPLKDPVQVFYKVYNLTGKPAEWKLEAKARLISESGEVVEIPPLSLDKIAQPTGTKEAAIGMGFSLSDAAPGKYKLAIEIINGVSKQSVTIDTDLRLY